MNTDDLKRALPNLHSAEVSSTELMDSPEEEVRELNDFDKSETEVFDRIKTHILSAQNEDELQNLIGILKESGYSNEFDVYLELRRGELEGIIKSFDEFLFHPHMIGKLMGGIPKPLTDPQAETLEAYLERNNGEGKPLNENQLTVLGDLLGKKNAKVKLSDAAKKELDTIFWNATTGRSKRIYAKQLDKGIICEDKTIALYEDVMGGIFVKNKTRKKNKFFNGECDNSQGKIRDVKTSWEYSSFPVNEDEIPSKDYEWQLDAYMDLWELKDSELIYGLVDTPFKIIEDEIRRLDWKLDILTNEGDVREGSIDLVVELVCSHIFTRKGLSEFCEQSTSIKLEWFVGKFFEIPKKKRLKIFPHAYCEKRNEQLKEVVRLSRIYLNNQLKNSI